MQLPSIDIMPFPNSVFYLTGLSLLTLVYATYSKTINKLPQAVSEGIITTSSNINELGKSVSIGTKDLYNKMATPFGAGTGPGPGPDVVAPAPAPIIAPPTNPQPGPQNNILENMNPFAQLRPAEAVPRPAEAVPRPPVAGGSKKKRAKRNKKTKRSRR